MYLRSLSSLYPPQQLHRLLQGLSASPGTPTTHSALSTTPDFLSFHLSPALERTPPPPPPTATATATTTPATVTSAPDSPFRYFDRPSAVASPAATTSTATAYPVLLIPPLLSPLQEEEVVEAPPAGPWEQILSAQSSRGGGGGVSAPPPKSKGWLMRRVAEIYVEKDRLLAGLEPPSLTPSRFIYEHLQRTYGVPAIVEKVGLLGSPVGHGPHPPVHQPGNRCVL
mgnify:FL=1